MPGNRNVLYLVIGVLIVAVGVLSYNLYQGQAGTRGPADQCRARWAEDQDQVREAVLTITKAAPRCLALPAGLALWLIATAAVAQTFSREQDIADLRLGQRVLVDDGSCPAGQIKEVMGSQMTTSGVLRTRKCIQRLGTKKR